MYVYVYVYEYIYIYIYVNTQHATLLYVLLESTMFYSVPLCSNMLHCILLSGVLRHDMVCHNILLHIFYLFLPHHLKGFRTGASCHGSSGRTLLRLAF